MEKITQKNYQTVWANATYGDKFTYSKHFKFADIAWHSSQMGVSVLPVTSDQYPERCVEVVGLKPKATEIKK